MRRRSMGKSRQGGEGGPREGGQGKCNLFNSRVVGQPNKLTLVTLAASAPQRNCGQHPVSWRELGRPAGGVLPRRPPAREGHTSWVYRDTVFVHSGFTDDPRVWAMSLDEPELRWVPIMPRGEWASCTVRRAAKTPSVLPNARALGPGALPTLQIQRCHA